MCLGRVSGGGSQENLAWLIISVGLIFLFNFLYTTTLYMSAPLLPPDAEMTKDVYETGVGLITGSIDVSILLFCFILPQHMRFFNMKTYLWFGIVVFSAFNVLFGLMTWIDSKWLYIGLSVLIRLVMGFGLSLSLLASMPLLFSYFPKNKGRLVGIGEVFYELGNMSGPALASLLYYLNGYFLPFAVNGIFGGVCALMILICLKPYPRLIDSETEPIGDSDSEKTHLTKDVPKLYDTGKSSNGHELNEQINAQNDEKSGWNLFLGSPKVLLGSLPYVLNSSTLGFLSVYLPIYLIFKLEVKMETIGLYYLPGPLACMLLSPITGFMTDFGYGLRLFLLAPVLGIFGYFGLGFVLFYEGAVMQTILITNLILVTLSSSLSYISMYIVVDSIAQSQTNREFTVEDEIRVNSWNNICYTVGRLIGNFIVGGVLFDLFGYEVVIGIQFSLQVLSLILSIIFVNYKL